MAGVVPVGLWAPDFLERFGLHAGVFCWGSELCDGCLACVVGSRAMPMPVGSALHASGVGVRAFSLVCVEALWLKCVRGGAWRLGLVLVSQCDVQDDKDACVSGDCYIAQAERAAGGL